MRHERDEIREIPGSYLLPLIRRLNFLLVHWYLAILSPKKATRSFTSYPFVGYVVNRSISHFIAIASARNKVCER